MTDDALPDPTLLNVLHAERLRWIFVGGKGGVGKTTTSCALACQLASVRKSVLLISTDPAHNLSDAFRQKFTRSPTPVNGVPNLFAMEVDPTPDDAAAALVGAGGPAADAAAFLGDLATAVPGIDEAMAFAEVMRQVTALDHDAIVFDTAPTGHTLRLLQFPATLQKGLDKLMSLRGAIGGALGALGPLMGAPADAQAALMGKLEELKSVVDEVNTQFTDPDRTTFVCVCIPEFLSLYETERLVQALAGFKIDCRNVCINQVIAPGAAGTSVLLAARARMQATYLAQFEELYEDFHLVRTPLLAEEVRGVDALKAFSTFLVDPAAAAAAGAALAAPGGGGGGGSAREAELFAEVAALKDKVGKLEGKCARWRERWAVCGPDDYDGWTTPSDEEGGGV